MYCFIARRVRRKPIYWKCCLFGLMTMRIKLPPFFHPTPIDAIRYQADEPGLSSAALAALPGGKNRLSEVLNRKRPLTLKMIKTLYHELQIPTDSLLAA